MPRTRVARDVLSALDSASPGVAQHAALTAASCHATASPGQKPAAPLLPVLEGGVACARRRRQQAQQRADLAGVPPGGADSLVQQLQLLSRAGAFLAREAEEEREVAARAESRLGARLVYPHWTQDDQLRPRAAPINRFSARTAPAARDPRPASWPCVYS